MTTFSPITGYGLTPETIGAAPTNTSPLVGSAATGADINAALPPDPMGGGALPNAGVPTGYDTDGAYLVDGAGNYIQPPVSDMGVAGPASSSGPVATTTAATGGGPTGPSGWNADYGDAFARAFTGAGVSPQVASAALHTLAANAPTTAELDEALQYLSTAEGMELAPYLAENLAKSAPGYAAMDESSSGPLPTGMDPTAYPADPTGLPSDPTAGVPTESTSGGLEVVGQNPDGTYVLSDGRTIVAQTEDGNLVLDDGSVLDQEGNEIAPAGSMPVDGTGAEGGEVDPTTGAPVDPNAAEAGAVPGEETPADEGGIPGWLVGAGALGAGVGGLVLYKNVIRPRMEARRAERVGATDAGRTPAAGGPEAARTPTRPAPPSTHPARISMEPDTGMRFDRFERNAARLTERLANPDLDPATRANTERLLANINREMDSIVAATPHAATPAAAAPVNLGDQMRRLAQIGEVAETRLPMVETRKVATQNVNARTLELRGLNRDLQTAEKTRNSLIAQRELTTDPHKRGVLTKQINKLEAEIPKLNAKIESTTKQLGVLDGHRIAADRAMVPIDHQMALIENDLRAARPKPAVTAATREAAESLSRGFGDDLAANAAHGAARLLNIFK